VPTADVFAGVRGLLIDLDGVVYTGAIPIPGAAEFLAEARRRGLPFLLITNNSTTSSARVAERLAGMGIPVHASEILTSAQAAAAHIRLQAIDGAPVQVIGEAGLREAIATQGLTIKDGDEPVDWVVVGLDRSFDYAKLARAARSILYGARFVATNADALLPVEGGELLPGAGAMVGAIRAATGVEPVVVGKPEAGLFEHGLRRLGGLPPDEVAMVGDRLDTDVAGGKRAGLRTVLVLSGISTADQVAHAVDKPDAVVANLGAVAGLLGWRDSASAGTS
jgi:4-nitrophenyl phosphatase